MRVESTQETSSVPGPDVPALNAGFYRKLISGPVEDLCRCFGLGNRVVRTLKALDCKRGPDVMKLDLSRVFSIKGAGGATFRRILLLQRYLKLWKQTGGDNASPSGTNPP